MQWDDKTDLLWIGGPRRCSIFSMKEGCAVFNGVIPEAAAPATAITFAPDLKVTTKHIDRRRLSWFAQKRTALIQPALALFFPSADVLRSGRSLDLRALCQHERERVHCRQDCVLSGCHAAIAAADEKRAGRAGPAPRSEARRRQASSVFAEDSSSSRSVRPHVCGVDAANRREQPPRDAAAALGHDTVYVAVSPHAHSRIGVALARTLQVAHSLLLDERVQSMRTQAQDGSAVGNLLSHPQSAVPRWLRRCLLPVRSREDLPNRSSGTTHLAVSELSLFRDRAHTLLWCCVAVRCVALGSDARLCDYVPSLELGQLLAVRRQQHGRGFHSFVQALHRLLRCARVDAE